MLRDHPLPMSAHFERSLVLTWAVPAEAVAALAGPGLTPETWEGLGFVAVAMVQTSQMRPSAMPAWAGRRFFLVGYRIFVRFQRGDGRRLRGLRILRSDTDSAGMSVTGNWMTRYNWTRADVSHEELDGRWRVRAESPGADLDVQVELGEGGRLPEGSPFPDLETARRFSGPLPHTFSYDAARQSMVVVKGLRGSWSPRPVTVRHARSQFIEEGPFAGHTARLANAFLVEDVDYAWKPGVVEPLPEGA